MKCGFFENDITPLLGLNLPGYFCMRPSEGVRDRLQAKAMAITDGRENTFILISVDAVSADSEMTDLVRERVFKETGVPRDHIMLAATHTHTGGPVDNFVPGTRDRQYIHYMCAQAADAGIMAFRGRKKARIGFGRGFEDTISFIRRYLMKDGSFATNPGWGRTDIEKPAGSIDPSVNVMRIDDEDGNLMGVVTNFACHLDTVGGNMFCADYPGELSRMLKKAYGQDIVSIFLTGACGNINHYDFMHRNFAYYAEAKPAHYVRMGRILAGDVIRALADVETGEADVSVANGAFTSGIRTPSEQDVKKAQALLAQHPYEVYVSTGAGTSTGPADITERHFAQALLTVHAMKEKTLGIPLQAARIGEAVLVGLPCELFVEFGLAIKAHAKQEHVFLSTLTNGHFGYISTREAFDQGGYEVAISGDTMMEPDTGYSMVDAIRELLRDL